MKYVGVVALMTLLMACTITAVVSFPSDPEIPEDLGIAVLQTGKEGICPNLEGAYMPPVEKYVIQGNSVLRKGVEFSDYFGLFPWALAEKSGSESGEKMTNSAYLNVFQPSNDSVMVYLNIDADTKINFYHFRETESDYSCENGVLRFPTRQSFGSIEGTTVNGQIRVSLRPTTDGALVALRTHGVYRGFPDTDSNKFVHEFFRFEPVSLSGGD